MFDFVEDVQISRPNASRLAQSVPERTREERPPCQFQQRLYAAVDDADKVSCRPDFAVALYPGHLWMPEHGQFGFNPDIHVTPSWARVTRHVIVFLLFLGTLLLRLDLHATTLSKDAVGSAGGQALTNTQHSLSFTLGLAAVGQATSPQHDLLAGFWFRHDNVTDVEQSWGVIPRATRLYSNHPNPFNPSTTLRFDIGGRPEVAVHATLQVFDVNGRLVTTLVNTELSPGEYRVNWDGRDAASDLVATGVYFGRLTAGDIYQTTRLVLLK